MKKTITIFLLLTLLFSCKNIASKNAPTDTSIDVTPPVIDDPITEPSEPEINPVLPDNESEPITPIDPYFIIDYENVDSLFYENKILKLDNSGALIFNKYKNNILIKSAKINLSDIDIIKIENLLKNYATVLEDKTPREVAFSNIPVEEAFENNNPISGLTCNFSISIKQATQVALIDQGKLWEVKLDFKIPQKSSNWCSLSLGIIIDFENATCIKDHYGNQNAYENGNIKLVY